MTLLPLPDHVARPHATYSARARIGLIVPPTNTVNEAEWAQMMPAGASFHTHRMRLHSDTQSETGKAALLEDLAAVYAMLIPADPDVIAYACTAGSMTTPVEELPTLLTARSGRRSITTASAIIAALRALSAANLSVATPYAEALNLHEAHFLHDHGFSVDRLIGLQIGASGPADYVRIARTPLDTIEAHARAAFVPGSDALLITCTDFPTLPLIARLEADLGVPVVTSNQATLWMALRACGIKDVVPGAGRLFAQ